MFESKIRDYELSLDKIVQEIHSIDKQISNLRSQKSDYLNKKNVLEKALKDEKRLKLNIDSNNSNNSISIDFTQSELYLLISEITNDKKTYFLKDKLKKINENLKETLDNRELAIVYFYIGKNLPSKTISTILKISVPHTKQILETAKVKILKSKFISFFESYIPKQK